MARIAIVAAPLPAEGLAAALSGVPGWDLVPLAAGADVLLLHGVEAAALLQSRQPAVLVADGAPQPPAAPEPQAPLALLGSDATPEQLRAAVAAVLAGLSVRDPAFAWAAADIDHEPLTPRELEVFELLGKGLSNRDIGGVLGISAHTAKYHVGEILTKVGAATRAEAVRRGLQLGVIGL